MNRVIPYSMAQWFSNVLVSGALYILKKEILVTRVALFYSFANLFNVWLDFHICLCIRSVVIISFRGST